MIHVQIKKILTVAVIILASFNATQLQADLQGDAARARAATKAAIFAAQNVASLNKEIKAKRQQITRTDRLFDELQKRKRQWQDQVEKTKKQLVQSQNILAATQEKITKKTATAQEKIQELQPLVTIFQQANMTKEIAMAEQTSQQFQKTAREVTDIFKTEQANLEKINTALTALEGK